MLHIINNSSKNNQLIANNVGRVALKAFFRLAELWDVNQSQQSNLLGGVDRATINRWKKKIEKNEEIHLGKDVLDRLSCILGIHKALRIIYSDKKIAYGWIKRKSPIFSNKAPIDFIEADGSIFSIYTVRQYLDQLRGGN